MSGTTTASPNAIVDLYSWDSTSVVYYFGDNFTASTNTLDAAVSITLPN